MTELDNVPDCKSVVAIRERGGSSPPGPTFILEVIIMHTYMKTKDGRIWVIYGEKNNSYICYPYKGDNTNLHIIDYDDVLVVDSNEFYILNQ